MVKLNKNWVKEFMLDIPTQVNKLSKFYLAEFCFTKCLILRAVIYILYKLNLKSSGKEHKDNGIISLLR